MAIAVEMLFRGATVDQYDEVIQSMGFTPEGKGAPHGLFHWVAETDDGLKVVDVWDSKEEYDKFAQEEIGPKTQAAGVESPPEVTVYELHNYLTAG